MMPIVNGLETEFEGRITVMRLDANVPENGRFQGELELRGHPTIAIIDENGVITHRFIGEQEVESLRRAIQSIITN